MGVRSPDKPKETTKRGKKPSPRELGARVQMGKGKQRIDRIGVAALADDELHFHTGRTGRGGVDFSFRVKYDDITEMEVDVPAGTLTITATGHDTMTFVLNRHATDWKKMIETRPTPLDELGVKPNSRIVVLSVDDDEVHELLASRVKGFAAHDEDVGEDGLDLLFVGVEHRADLPRIGPLAKRVKRPGGVIWVLVANKTRALTITDIAVAGRSAGLVDGGTVDVTKTMQALRLNRI